MKYCFFCTPANILFFCNLLKIKKKTCKRAKFVQYIILRFHAFNIHALIVGSGDLQVCRDVLKFIFSLFFEFGSHSSYPYGMERSFFFLLSCLSTSENLQHSMCCCSSVSVSMSDRQRQSRHSHTHTHT